MSIEVFLFGRAVDGAALLESVRFGPQAAGFSIGRSPDATGPWTLNVPSRSSHNIVMAPGDERLLKVNEWLANPVSGDDWFEIYNDGLLPVNLGGLYLTDNLLNHDQFQVQSLSFIGNGTNRFARFLADGSPDRGPDHVNFKLASAGEAIGIFTADGTLIDSVTFGPQALGQSEGRLPDGASTIVMLDPTPAAPIRAFLTAEKDSDGDGLPDTWEIAHGLDPKNGADAEQDSDGDGSNNLAEFKAGTDPRDAASALKIRDVTYETGGISLRFEAAAGRAYVIESTGAFSEQRWTVLREIPAENQARSLEVIGLPAGMPDDERYFRIVLRISP